MLGLGLGDLGARERLLRRVHLCDGLGLGSHRAVALVGDLHVGDDAQRDERDEAQRGHDQGRLVLAGPALHERPGAVVVSLHTPAGHVRADLFGHRARVGVAVVGVARQGLLSDRGELGRGLGADGVDGLEAAVDDLQEQVDRGLAVERHLARQDLVEHDAQRPYVRTFVDRLEVALGLLGAHVHRRAEQGAVVGRGEAAARVGGACARVARVVGDGGFVAAQVLGVLGLGQAPVEYDGLAELADHDVLGLDVAVDDAAAVRVRDGVAEVGVVADELHARAQAVAFDGLQRGGEVAAAHDLHRVVEGAVGAGAELVHGHDVGVLELAGEARLAQEARGRERLAGVGRGA